MELKPLQPTDDEKDYSNSLRFFEKASEESPTILKQSASESFCFWLQGFVETTKTDSLTSFQWDEILKKLDETRKQTPPVDWSNFNLPHGVYC